MDFTYNPDRYYIVELKKSHILLMAQLLHVHLSPGHKILGEELLKSLVVQTDFVSQAPRDHKVFKTSEAPANATSTNPVWYIPYDTYG